MIGNVQNISYKQTISNAENNTQIKEAASGVTPLAADNTPDSVHISDDGLPWREKIKLHGDRVGAYELFAEDREAVREILDLFEGFYSGSKSIEDVMAEFDILVGKIHELDYEMNVAAKEDTEHYGKIVSSVYQRFKFHLVQQAFCANHTEGKQIADQYGMPGNRNFAYYNSDYYYKSEEIDDLLIQHASNMLKDAGTEMPLNTKMANPDFESFNAYMKHWTLYECRQGDIIDVDMKPPRGFVFLYKESRYTQEEVDAMGGQLVDRNSTSFDGLLRVTYGKRSVEGNVNLRYEMSEAKGFDLYELLNTITDDKWEDDLLEQFLKNINIHRACYTGVYLQEAGVLRYMHHSQ